MTLSPSQRALRQLLGVGRRPSPEPVVREGYSANRRAVAGLLGVRLTGRFTGELAVQESPGLYIAAQSRDEPSGEPSGDYGYDAMFAEAAYEAITQASPSRRLHVRLTLTPLAIGANALIAHLLDLRGMLGEVGPAGIRGYANVVGRLIISARDRALAVADALDGHVTPDTDLALGIARRLTVVLDDALRSELHPSPAGVGSALIGDRDLSLSLARDLAQVFNFDNEDLATAVIKAKHDFDFGNGPLDLGYALHVARKADRAYARELRIMLGFAAGSGDRSLTGAALAGAVLNGALDDFTQADLSEVYLDRVNLIGVRWSKSTQWPASFDRAALLRRSRETAPGSGIYVLSPPGRSREDVHA